ncbi:MAG: aldose 1-epimerase family protein [Acetobacteraceae bacterium]|nr:aldose 1-epimerase family protein [Acetobacteraceae bacterium]
MDQHIFCNTYLAATVKADGAELCSLRDATGQEFLWHAGPVWPWHAPVLFPVVGQVNRDEILHRGRRYRMGRHGYARNRRFAWLNRTAESCRLVLHDDSQTRASYPFAFRFEITYALQEDKLEVTYTIVNPGREALPASAGAHPAFIWPLLEGVPKQAHLLEFSQAEPEPVRRLVDGLIMGEAQPTAVEGSTLRLDPALFVADAIIWDQPASRSIRYTAPSAPSIEVTWDGFQQLGVWSKAGIDPSADFLCIEPSYGTADPAGWEGEFEDKPNLMLIPPGERRVLTYRIRIC